MVTRIVTASIMLVLLLAIGHSLMMSLMFLLDSPVEVDLGLRFLGVGVVCLFGLFLLMKKTKLLTS